MAHRVLDLLTQAVEDAAEAKSRSLTGICLAIGGNLVIALALNLTKHAHNENQRRPEPLPYVQLPLWWLGFCATLLGELGNFAAYGFAEASVIAPLGAVAVIANAFIAAHVLGEGFRMRDLLGCLFCIAGGSVIVASAPAHPEDAGIDVFMENIQEPSFVAYIVGLALIVIVMLGFQDKYGHQHVSFYVLLCSLIGSVTVMACKGLSSFLTLWLFGEGDAPFTHPVLYLLLFVLASTAVLQLRYLNQAMENFGNTETVPVYYVMFNICTIVGSNMLYKDFVDEDRMKALSFGGGCLLTFQGVRLLTASSKGNHTAEQSGGSVLTPQENDDEPSLDRLYQPFGREPPMELAMTPTLMHQPMGMSGDVLRRTFTQSESPIRSPRIMSSTSPDREPIPYRQTDA